MSPTGTVTIAIPTFRRPDGLARLLNALPPLIEEAPDGARIGVLVVDNDPNGSAESTALLAGTPLRYVVEPRPGIAAARNRALDECSSADLLVFIDDDEVPRPGWLRSLLGTAHRYGAAAVMGRVISVFDESVDPWILASGTFHRPERPTGTGLGTAASGNLLLDLRQVRALGLRFDESLGLSQGEDTLFSRQLVQRGGTIVWCNESQTEDFVVAARLTRSWARQRAFSSANSTVRTELALQPSRARHAALRMRFLAGGTARMAIGGARHVFGRLTGDIRHDARGTRLVHRGLGMMAGALGHVHEEYRR